MTKKIKSKIDRYKLQPLQAEDEQMLIKDILTDVNTLTNKMRKWVGPRTKLNNRVFSFLAKE